MRVRRLLRHQAVRPLTRRTIEGVRYVRPAVVEREIEAALREDPVTLHWRLSITDKGSSEYLRSESLVHLLRDAIRRMDEELQNAILPILLARCDANLKVKIKESLPRADELREEVLFEFSKLLASDGRGNRPDELDFYECRFNQAFFALRVDVVRRRTSQLDPIAELPVQKDERKPYNYNEDAFARHFEALQTPATQQERLYVKELVEAIKGLPADVGKAFVLCRLMGYKVESVDPTEVTAATLCNCSGKTIRNRLSRAVAILSRLKEDV